MSNELPGWNIDELVLQLRQIRVHSLEQRQRLNMPPKLPSRKELGQIVELLSAVLFPNRLGVPGLNDQSLDYYVGHTLDTALRKLQKQLALELNFAAEENGQKINAESLAFEAAEAFSRHLPQIRNLIDTDIQAAYEGDPAAQSPDEVLVCYPGIVAVLHHRLAHILYGLGFPLVARMIAEIAHSSTGIDIHPGAKIDESFFIDHGTGVVIGETAIIGKNVRLYQAVTLGAKRFDKDETGMLVKGNARHPIVEDQVVIYAGATILGRITIGARSVIGGNVWLTYSVPADSHISQAQSAH